MKKLLGLIGAEGIVRSNDMPREVGLYGVPFERSVYSSFFSPLYSFLSLVIFPIVIVLGIMSYKRQKKKINEGRKIEKKTKNYYFFRMCFWIVFFVIQLTQFNHFLDEKIIPTVERVMENIDGPVISICITGIVLFAAIITVVTIISLIIKRYVNDSLLELTNFLIIMMCVFFIIVWFVSTFNMPEFDFYVLDYTAYICMLLNWCIVLSRVAAFVNIRKLYNETNKIEKQ